jgi:hypothetical protein
VSFAAITVCVASQRVYYYYYYYYYFVISPETFGYTLIRSLTLGPAR